MPSVGLNLDRSNVGSGIDIIIFSTSEQVLNKIRWGILGTGNIARQFALGLSDAPCAELIAVGSRSLEKALAFGHEFGIPRCHGAYAELAEDPGLDVVYVATPHTLHVENTISCLRAGKAVLCEKPIAINETQAREAIDIARQNKLFLMEAMWTRFLPPFVQLRRMLADGAIGKARFVSADLGFKVERDPESRLFDPNLGGGCLLDLGIYPISLATMVLGTPAKVSGEVSIGPTGVDEEEAITMSYAGGQLASLFASIRTRTHQQASIFGTEGFIHFLSDWWKGGQMSVTAGEKSWKVNAPVEGNGYQYEAEEVGRCLEAGKFQSDVMSWEESLTVLRTMDQLRAMWGLKYPME
jgi:predicted dehydrogenase